MPGGFSSLTDLERVKDETGTVRGAFGKTITSEELLALPVDVLVPAALDDVLTEATAVTVKAPIILELANGPTTLAADTLLRRKGTAVLPDVMANAGGVAVSYFEWYQNLHGERWTKDEVFEKLRVKMEAAVSRVHQASLRHHTGLRQAAYAVALGAIQDCWQEVPARAPELDTREERVLAAVV
jgi:glutamate dehydrogenase/leucine dehydrogenase